MEAYEDKLIRLWNSLDEDQQSDLWCLYDNGIFEDEEFEEMCEEIIRKPE